MTQPRRRQAVLIENAQIIFRNFAGKEGEMNRAGDRNFSVLLEPDTAEELRREGWNVKQLRAREEGDPRQDFLPVSVSFKIKPPRLVLLTSNGRNVIGEEECEVFDWVDIEFVDVTIRPYEWTVRGESGIKAYVKTLYVKVLEDPLDLKYADLEELPARSGRLELPSAPEVKVIDGDWQ